MTRYAAFLRGVSPMNCSMPALKRAFEKAGFTNVRTVISSGNVVFDARRTTASALERKAEAAMTRHLGRSFLTIVRSIEELERLLATDPYQRVRLPKEAKRNVTFLRDEPRARLERTPANDVWMVGMKDREVFSAHIPNNPKRALFMVEIERALGKDQTTRTWLTVQKVAKA